MSETTEITGTDLIRERLRAYIEKGNPSGLSRDVNLAISALDEFARGGKLAADKLSALTKWLFDHAEYDPAADKLKSTNTAPVTPLGRYPPVCESLTLPVFKPGPPTTFPGGLEPPRRKRPGWL